MNYMSGDGTNYAIGSKEIGKILVRVVTITLLALIISFVLEDGLQAAASPTVSLMRPWIYHLIICICTLIEFFSSAFPQEKGRNAQTFLPTVVPFLKKKTR